MKQLGTLATITIAGGDAKKFLQGQLSNDLELLGPHRALLACCNSAQGRVQVILTLVERDDHIIAIVPAAMTESFVARLGKYVLRSKVTITDTSNTTLCYTATSSELQTSQLSLSLPDSPGAHSSKDGTSIMRWWDRANERYLVLKDPDPHNDASDQEWLLADIRAGLPQILPPTHEMFVAQMLNLDVLGAISFSKGCYTGQEIIARAHYRGSVKRRLYRLAATCPPPQPGSRLVAANDASHAGDVVMAARLGTGCEMLAVLNVNQQEAELCLDTDRAASLKILPLPYELPVAG